MHDAAFDLEPQEWATLRQLLDQLLAQPAADRAAWIDALAEPHRPFAERLRALLAHAEDTGFGEVLQTLPKVETADFAAGSPGSGAATAPHAGQQVGPYRLLQPLGEGGMASVWLAERDDLLQGRQVALKLPRAAWRHTAWSQRLAREREILATLAHPHIARLYDAGIAADGQPYLALEYVKGQRIDEHCRERALGVRARLALFLQVAQAVAYAHAKLVVHRDLKPTNILVTAEGQVRLLDFGIAKLLDEGQAQATELTLETGRALTPDYAAPEQIRGEPIGTAADIYSLGVLLYELLAGQRPYRLKRGSRAALEEAILEAEPQAPSEAVADRRLRRELRGDLDTIVLKALKKAPAERYATALAFADDVQRHLSGQPVLARPDSRWYVFRKFVARNLVAASASAAVLAATIGGAGVAVWQARQAERERTHAEQVKDFIAGVFEKADPYVGQGKTLSAVELLVQAKNRFDALRGRPELHAELLLLVATSLGNLQDYGAAASVVDEAVHAATAAFGDRDPRTLRARLARVETNRYRGLAHAAREELDQLLNLLAVARPALPELRALALVQQAHVNIESGKGKAAQQAAEEALALTRKHLGDKHPDTVAASLVYAVALQYDGDARTALRAAEQALLLTRNLYGTQAIHARVVEAQALHARALVDSGQLHEGIALLEQAAVDAQTAFDAEAMIVGYLRARLARYRIESGQLHAALSDIDKSLAILRRTAAEDSVNVGIGKQLRGAILLELDRPQEALADLHSAAATLARDMGRDHKWTQETLALHAQALALLGQPQDAEAALREMAMASATSHVWHAAGFVHRLNKQPAQARQALQEALSRIADTPQARRQRASILVELGQLALEDKSPDAGGFFTEALAALDHAHVEPTPLHARAWLGLGRFQLQQGHHKAAEPLLRQAHDFWQKTAPTSPSARIAARWLRTATCQPLSGVGPWEHRMPGVKCGPRNQGISTSAPPS